MATLNVLAKLTGWTCWPRKTCCASAKCYGRDNISRTRGQLNKERRDKHLNQKTQSSCREEGYERTRVTESFVGVSCCDRGGGKPVRRAGPSPATDLLGMADREQPFHERAVRFVHAGSRIRARQHQAGEQHSERRPAGEYRRDQVRQ